MSDFSVDVLSDGIDDEAIAVVSEDNDVIDDVACDRVDNGLVETVDASVDFLSVADVDCTAEVVDCGGAEGSVDTVV